MTTRLADLIEPETETGNSLALLLACQFDILLNIVCA